MANRLLRFAVVTGLLLAPGLGAPAASAQEETTSEAAPGGEPEGNYARGFAIFQRYCRSCHGSEALGDGSVAPYLKVEPSNLTLLAAENGGEFPTERVLRSIDGRDETTPLHGRDMPIWGAVFMADEGQTEAGARQKLVDLVTYLQGIQVEPDETGAAED